MNQPGKRRRAANLFFPFRRRSAQVGWFGACYRWLDRIGRVTRCSPVRRGVQVTCLALFLFAFFYVCWPYAERFDETTFRDKETYPVELFLLLDPLAGISTVLAGKVLNMATLWWMLAILLFCIIVPRAFCGYFCPLGTLIDFFDWLTRGLFKRFHVPDDKPNGGWRHTRFYLLAFVLGSSLFGFLTAGFVAAIPVLTRGALFTAGRGQLALMKGTNHLPPIDGTFYLSVLLFAVVFIVGVWGRRFWCRFLCPTGALFSIFNLLHIGERKVTTTCDDCNKCIDVCPFDAINQDISTLTTNCTYCQVCGGACPQHSIKFVTRWNDEDLKPVEPSPAGPPIFSRRAFTSVFVLGAAGALLGRAVPGRGTADPARLIRPPGSLSEERFLDLCVRCGQCFQVCPGPALHPVGWEHGLEAMWTPVLRPDHAGCHQDCNACTQICPTGAIQPLDMAVKRKVHIGLAKIDAHTCLPFRENDRRECNLCYEECVRAGYSAIRMKEVRIELDPPPPEGMFSDMELEEMSRIEIPVVDPDLCVGCGICEYRCHTKFVVQEKLLKESAIRIFTENEQRFQVS